jgi:hypothetical protein
MKKLPVALGHFRTHELWQKHPAGSPLRRAREVLKEPTSAEFFAHVEEFARIIAPIAMRRHEARSTSSRATSSTKPPHRETLHGDKVREGIAALAEERPRF